MKTDSVIERQVVEFLKSRQQQLREELKSIEVTINAIGQTRSSFGLGSRSYGRDYDNLDKKEKNKILKPQEKFNINSKLDQKISYALTKLGSGYRDDILNVINKEQPDLDPYRLEKAVAVRLSYLLKNGFVRATKNGRSYKYTLIPQEIIDPESETASAEAPEQSNA